MARVSFKPKRVSSIDATSEVATVANGEVFVDSSTGMYYYKNTSGVVKQGFQEELIAAMGVHPAIAIDPLNSESIPSFLYFSRVTDGFYFGKSGYLTKAIPGAPRIEFNPVTGSCLGLLMENSTTNLFLSTQDFRSNTSGNSVNMWGNTNIAVSNSTVLAPDNATPCQLVTTSQDGACLSGMTRETISNGSRVAVSFFAKQKSSRYLRFELGGVVNCWFDLQEAVAGSHSAGNSNVTFNSKYVQKLRDGWVRCSAVVIVNGLSSLQVNVFATEQDQASSVTNGEVYLWGAQAEIAHSASSYFPTTTATQLRDRDYCVTADGFLRGSAVSMRGTIVAEVSGRHSAWQPTTVASLELNGYSRLQIRRSASASNNTLSDANTIAYQLLSGTTATSPLGLSAPSLWKGNPEEVHRFALSYERNNCGFAADGVSYGEDTTVDLPYFDYLGVGSSAGTSSLDGHVRSLLVYPQVANLATRIALTV